jgi:hypothetical protein
MEPGTRKKIGVAAVLLGALIAIPTGLDDLLINLPLGLGISKTARIPFLAALPLTYLLGLPLIAFGLLLLTRRQRGGILRKTDW